MFGLSKVAKSLTGKVSGFKSILNYTPQLSPFVLPPQVQLGLSVANSLGVRIPTPQQLTDTANGIISNELTKLRKPILNTLGKIEPGLATIETTSATLEEVINQINWLY